MIILEKQSKFTPNAQLGIMLVFSLGVLAAIALLIAALVAVAWFLNLAMATVAELSSNISALYGHSDAFTQFLLVCVVGYCLARVIRSASRSFRK